MNVFEFNKKKVFSEGSGVCAVVENKIEMVLNNFGIYEEKIDECYDFELNPLVDRVSPNLNNNINESIIAEKLYAKLDNIKFDDRLGYYKSLYIGHVIEEDFRINGSSGGMGTWILKELLEKNMIDGVIHVKQNKDTNSPILFKYDISYSIEEVKEGAKTKYYPVEFSKVIKTIKEKPGKYAIVGIPSFIMAIRLLAENDDIIRERIKYTIGLICGHQKSSKVAEAFGWQVGIKPGKLSYIDFRVKLPGNSSNNYGVRMDGYINGKRESIIKPIIDLIGDNWGEGYFKVRASDFSDDVMNETADITLGDAWLEEYVNDTLGNNVIIIRNAEINILVNNAIDSGKLKIYDTDVDTIIKSQSAHFRHTHDELSYRLFKMDKRKEWRPQKRVKASNKLPYFRRKIQDLREEISIKSHIIYQKAVELDDFEYFRKEILQLSKRYKRVYFYMSFSDKGIKGLFSAIKHRIIRVFD